MYRQDQIITDYSPISAKGGRRRKSVNKRRKSRKSARNKTLRRRRH